VNNDFLERAKKVITDPKALTIVASRRAKQLALGGRPMVRCKSENFLDVALLEIAEGKLDMMVGGTDGCDPDPLLVPEENPEGEAAIPNVLKTE